MRFITAIILCLSFTGLVSPCGADFEDRLISAIELQGIDTEDSSGDDHYRVKQQRVLNLIQSTVGEPYDPKIVEGDVHVLTHLGEFNYISADVVLQEDGTVHVIYTFREQQIITQVSVVGNQMVSDAELLFAVPIMEGLGRDEDAIDRGRRAIMDLYKEKGNYLVEVFTEIIVYGRSKDETTDEVIEESVVLIYRVMEGPRVRVGGVSFYGNQSFTDDELASEIDTNVAIPFFRRGELNEQILDSDVVAIKRFYTIRGFRDVRVSYTDPLSPNDKEASVLFLIEEGPQYTIGGISAEFHTIGTLDPVFSDEQIRGLIPIKVGDVYRQIDIGRAVRAINNAYGVLGRIIDIEPRQRAITRARQNMYGGRSSLEQNAATAVPYHAEPGSSVDIVFVITEGSPTKVGLIEIKGNTVTKDKVIRGRIGLKPGHPFNVQEANRSELRLMRTRLFNKVTMTIQPENLDTPGVRDLLVEVDESQTGSLNFGIMAGSDAGVLGNISLTQRNFDVADWPESWEEFWQRKAFVGAGQQFSMALQPGQELFNYELSLTDSRFLDTDYSVGGSFNLQKRDYDDYTQETTSSRLRVGRRFGDIWFGSVSLSSDRIELTEITDDVPQEIFDDRGPNTINSVGLSVSRTTLSPIASPTEGTRISFKLDNYGFGSGDYTFTKAHIDYTTYFAIHRDFLGRASTLRVDSRLGFIFGGTAPTFERFYLGGRGFRGFDYRTVSPKGTPRVVGGDPNVPIGGDFEFFLGAQYEFPLIDRFLSMVMFVDSGTVEESVGFEEYRVSVGTGLRLHIPQLGQVPLAFDFGFPVVKQDSDQTKAFSFSLQLPF